MAKSDKGKPSEPENIDTMLDTVLITALQENFEVKSDCHIDRNEILEFLRSVIRKHPELNFVLQHRDTKLSSRIYKAFPKVTTKRVAVPNIRGKKTYPHFSNLSDFSLVFVYLCAFHSGYIRFCNSFGTVDMSWVLQLVRVYTRFTFRYLA